MSSSRVYGIRRPITFIGKEELWFRQPNSLTPAEQSLEFFSAEPLKFVPMKCPLLFLAMLTSFLPPAGAAVFEYEFTATVTENAGSPLVALGDVVTGTFAYDANPTTAVRLLSNPVPYTWDRPALPIGIFLNANGMLLSQHPDNFARLFILNDEPILGDQCEFASFLDVRTVEDPILYSGGLLSLVLRDENGTALGSTDLPSSLLLSDFNSGELTVYDGINPFFSASIASLTPVPEPTGFAVFSMLTLLGLVRTRHCRRGAG